MKRPPEMSWSQFRAALKRHGFRLTLLWTSCPEHPTLAGHSIGIIASAKGKVYRRATLAKAIKFFEGETA